MVKNTITTENDGLKVLFDIFNRREDLQKIFPEGHQGNQVSVYYWQWTAWGIQVIPSKDPIRPIRADLGKRNSHVKDRRSVVAKWSISTG